ncbi:probable leucine-rich repeat receptor-like protein kinase At1g35710 [Quercus suber]|uniref:probable leucine-rich repeat receptor-like protein kinase At1g35710 n=1 Tax=Quercus suber TaxID=58331 RepID=UPI000CE2363E|nr:probable leucine-rich repeat receptor-like protein kinase At1g35710 [Quercus suber]
MTTQIKKPLSTHLISSPLLFFFIIITTLTLLSSSLSSASSTAPFVYVDGKAKVAKEPNEVEALLKWKTILHIKSQSVLSSWAGNTACNWVGISCDEFGSIINLNLSSHGLRELGMLISLRDLDLSLNHLTGVIPTSLGNLSNLAILALFGNQLTSYIPKELGMLNSASTLDLALHYLIGVIPTSLG